MVISDPDKEYLSFSPYGGGFEYLVEWQKSTKEEIKKVRAICPKNFADKVLNRLWRKRSEEEIREIKKLSPQMARNILNHIEYQMTPEEKEDQRKWEDHAYTLYDTTLQLETIKDKGNIDKIAYLENLLEEMKVLPPWKATREACQIYNDYLAYMRRK